MATAASGEDYGFEREGTRRRALLPDPAYLWMVFRRRLWLFLLAAAVVLVVAALALRLATPRYEATASVLIEPRSSNVIDFNAVVSGLPADTNVVDTEVQLIGSPTVALGVVRNLHLDSDPEFVSTSAAQPSSRAVSEAAAQITPGERTATANLLNHVIVRRAGLTYVINVTAVSTSGEKAARIANAVAREYLAVQTRRKVGTTSQAADWIKKRADQLREGAVSDDAALQRYMIAHNLMSAEGSTLAEQQVSQLSQQIAEAQSRLAEERGRLAAAQGQAERGGGGADTGTALSSPTISRLRDQETTVSAQLAQLQARYGELHPDVIKTKQQLGDIRAQLQAELGRIQSTLAANVRIAQSGLSSLESSLSRARGSLTSNGQAQVGLLELQRKAESSRTIYNAFLNRSKETAAQTTLPQADASISTLAPVPGAPVWPNRRLAAMFALGIAFLAGMMAIGAAEYLDDGVATRDDVEQKLALHYAGALPDLAAIARKSGPVEAPHTYVLSHPFSMFTESIRNLGAFAMLGAQEGRGWVVAITSSLPREGKSTLAVCLARTLAQAGRKVALVDGDLRRHSISNLLFPELGEEKLLAVTNGTLAMDEALTKDPDTNLMVLPTRGPINTTDELSDERVQSLLAALRTRFDVVVIDTAPVLGVVDARTFARYADATVLLARWRSTGVKAARATVDLLLQSGVRIAGMGLSLVDIRQHASTGLGTSAGYHRKFTGYYVD